LKNLKLNDPVAIVIGGSIAFGVVSEIMDRTSRFGIKRSVMVEVAKEDPKTLKPDDIPELDGYLISRDDLIQKIDETWKWGAPEEMADCIRNAYLYHWALARSTELNGPPPAVEPAQVDTARPLEDDGPGSSAPSPDEGSEDTNPPGSL
jgi:hypothetical protein